MNKLALILGGIAGFLLGTTAPVHAQLSVWRVHGSACQLETTATSAANGVHYNQYGVSVTDSAAGRWLMCPLTQSSLNNRKNYDVRVYDRSSTDSIFVKICHTTFSGDAKLCSTAATGVASYSAAVQTLYLEEPALGSNILRFFSVYLPAVGIGGSSHFATAAFFDAQPVP